MSGDADQAEVVPGTRFGNYVLGQRLAAGGMAEVYHAESLERRFSTPIVLKRMHSRLAKNREFVDMFIDEARISTRLEHPNIVQVFDFEATERGLFLIMELVDGPDLLSVIKRCAKERSRIPDELAVFIACHTLEALDYAHTATENGRPLNVVHRDVSPSNVLITRRGKVKLADFGIARATERQNKSATGTLRGKYGYMSPEQVLGRNLDGRSDVFSLAVMLAEMLMSRRLFTAPGGDVDVLLMVRRGDLSRLDKYGEHIDGDLQQILRTAMSVNREDRYPTAGVFLDALADWLSRSKKRTGSDRLAAFIRGLEQRGGDLCGWGERPSSSRSTTLSGPETKLARLAVKKRDAVGRQLFARAQAKAPVTRASTEDLGLAHYDGSAVPEEDHEPGASRAHEIALDNGSLDEVHPIEVLCEIGHRRLTGILVVRQGGRVKETYFRDGHPEFVRSNVPEERFGQYLVGKGILTPDELERALGVLAHFEGRLGQALVSLELLKPVDAVRLLTEQVYQKLVDVCSWTAGRYFFREGARNPFPGLELHLNTLQIVGRSLRALPPQLIIDWGKRYRERKPIIDLEAADELELAPALRERLLLLAHGDNTLGQVVRSLPSAAERRRMVAAAYVLWRCGMLELPRPSTGSRPRPLPPARERRRSPRAEVHAAATVEVFGPTDRAPQNTILATVCYVTPEGLGVYISRDARGALQAKDSVVLRFLAGVRQLEIAGTVVWHAPESEDEVNTGIELDAALTSETMRAAYTAWLKTMLGG